MTDLKITEATVQLVVNEQEPVFLQVLRGPIVVSGGGGVTVHNDLTGRSGPDTHPISSITGLSAALAAAGNVDSVNGQTGTVVLDLDDLTDVDTTTDPPDADDVLAWDGVMWTPATLTALGAPGLSNATPADLGTAAPGVSTEASRADHVHDMPTAADIAVDASGFNGNLTTSDDTVQEIAQKLDDLTIPAAGIADPGGANDDFLQRKSGAWTYRTVAQVKSDLGVEHPMFMETAAAISIQSNAMWLPGVEFSTSGGGTTNVALNMTAGTVALLPAVLTETVTITKIAHGVTVAQTNTHTFRMGIYSANSDWTTGTLVQSATYTSDGTTGLKTITSLSWTLTPGRYFYAYLIPPGESIPSGRWSIPTYRGGTTGHSNHPIGACASSTTSNATLPSSVTVTKVTSGGTPIAASVWPWGVQG